MLAYVMLTYEAISEKSFPRDPKVNSTVFKASDPFCWNGIAEEELEGDQRIVGMFSALCSQNYFSAKD